MAHSNDAERVNPIEHFGLGLLVVISVALLTHTCHDTAFVNRLEMANLDSWMSFQRPGESADIVVVEITDAEYRSMFSSKSPLSPAKVGTLLWAIAVTGPRVIGVDLDTSDWTAAERTRARDRYAAAHVNGLQTPIPFVWALGGDGYADSLNLDETKGRGNEDCFAVPATLEDSDGIARWYLPFVISRNQKWPGFASAVVNISRGVDKACRAEKLSGTGERSEPMKVNFRGGRIAFPHLAASTVLGAAFTAAWAGGNPLRGKIVLLGGAYRAARDSYMTPLGRLNGVDILAHSIRTALPGGAIQDASAATFITVDILIGLFLVTLTFFVRSAWMLLASLAIILPLAFLASPVAYNSYAYFASFMPVLLGVFIHEVVEHIREHHKLLLKLRHLRGG